MRDLKIVGYILALCIFWAVVYFATKNLDPDSIRNHIVWYGLAYFCITRFLILPSISYNYSKFWECEIERYHCYIPFYQDTFMFSSSVQLIAYWVSLGAGIISGLVYYKLPTQILMSSGMSIASMGSLLDAINLIMIISFVINRLVVGHAYFVCYRELAGIEDFSDNGKRKSYESAVVLVISIMLFIPLVRQVANMFVLNLTSKFSKYTVSDLE